MLAPATRSYNSPYENSRGFQNDPAEPLLPVPVVDLSNTPPAPATGLNPAALARLRRSLDSSVPNNTRTMYISVW